MVTPFDALLPEPALRDLSGICTRHRVRSLDIFGSAVTGAFDPRASDVDLVVDFEDMPPDGQAELYFSLRSSLEVIFGREVDLLTRRSIDNPYLLRSIETTQQRLFESH